MSEPEKKKRPARKEPGPASKKPAPGGDATGKEQSESDDIERAVYDGMQDLRVKKPG